MGTHTLGAVNQNFTDPRENMDSKDTGSRRNLGPVIYTANGAGTTTTLVGAAPASGANAVRVGDKGVVFNSSGVAKDNWRVVTVTAVNAGGTTVTFAPALSANTASGDVLRTNNPQSYADNDALDARLLAIGGVYTQSYIDTLTQNDKIFAIRKNDDPSVIY